VIRRLILALALVVAASGVFTACGSSKSDEDQVKDTTQQLLDSDKDVCDKLTDRFLQSTFGGSKDKCQQSAEKGDNSPDAKLTKVTVKGERATVTVKDKDGNNKVLLVKDGGWEIDRLVAAAGGKSNTVKARAAVDAFLQAIKDDDANVFCGLLSEKFARSVTGKSQFGVAECVSQVKKSGLASVGRKVGKAKTKNVVLTNAKSKTTGASKPVGAIVTLSSGDVIALRFQGNRYVIDGINGNK
jgi:hypothetical protein